MNSELKKRNIPFSPPDITELEIEEVVENSYQWPQASREMPVYHYEGRVIWGLTAMLLKDFASIVNNAKR